MAFDRIVGSDVDGNLPPVVQNILDDRTGDIVAAAIPAISPLQVLMIGDGTSALPIRPTTSNPVIFNTTGVVPLNGTTLGGTTGMVPGLDKQIGATGGGGGGTPSLVITENPVGSGTYANRPASTSQVTWQGVVPPYGGGTTAGGSPLMVNNLDLWAQWVLG